MEILRLKMSNRPIKKWYITVNPEYSDSITFTRLSKDDDTCGIFTSNIQKVPGLIIQALQATEREYIP